MVKPCLHVSSISCFLYCVFISSFFVNTLVSLPFPRPDQIEILMDFKNEFPILKCTLPFFPDPKTKSWTTKDVKSFDDAVVFDNVTGVVTELHLYRACLSGILSANSSLFRLHHLRYLDLSHNYFDSFSFLPELVKLTNLESLYLSHMGLAGEIPSSFSSLNRLTELDLSDNELMGSFSPLFNLSKLSSLDLSHNLFSGNVPSSLFNLSKLSSLDLYDNLFSGNIPCSLLTMPFLSQLDLSQNHLSDSLETVNCSSSSSKLERLYLNNNRLSGRILEPLSKLTNLKDLYLSFQDTTYPNNFISSLDFKSVEYLDLSSMGLVGEIPSSISSLNRLTDLKLSGNKLIGSLYPLRNLSKLSSLDLSHNLFSGNVPCSLLTMPFLSTLDLSQNHLSNSLETMNCSSSSKLERLHLSYNRLSGQILEPLSKLKNLKYLYLASQNTIDPINFVSSLGFKSLEELVLSGNAISILNTGSPNLKTLLLNNCSINEFPKFIQNLQKLEILFIGTNKLKGEVPKWLWSLPSLTQLSLSNNSLDSFEGSPEMLLNSSLGTLDLTSNAFRGSLPIISPRLRYMLASNNNFTGDIPLSLCNQSFLNVLDLSHNNFSGSIPRCLILNSSVENMDLRNNNLIGNLPDIFSRSGLLRTLDVSQNQITGKLPRSLTNCTYLEVLNVESNRIIDTFPFWLQELPNLQVMVLRSNMFHGPIYSPQHHLSFPQLQILDISRNRFTGRLPHDYFFNWSTPLIRIPQEEGGPRYIGDSYSYPYYASMYLRNKGINMELKKIFLAYTSIDFSENKFGGQIPESIGLLKSLIVLNLSSNDFTGHIPSSWANLTSLESLDLSRNQLSGTIPQELATLSFLEYINVSHNKLTGQIPQGTQIGGQPKSSFEGNLNLCGPPLEESCFREKVPSTPEAQETEPLEQELVLNWKAAAIGYGPGVLFGLAIGQVFYSYKPVLFYKLFRL